MTDISSLATLYIRCAGLHSRGELLHDFFHAHRAALGLEGYYEPTSIPSESAEDQGTASTAATTGSSGSGAASSRLPADFPVEVVYVRQSRKPYFLVEWRYPTVEEAEKKKAGEGTTANHNEEDREDEPAASPAAASTEPSPASRLSNDILAQLTQRTLALGKSKGAEGGLVWRDQPVTISTALAGMTVAAERVKLELRDAQLKTQRVAEKRTREQADGVVKGGKSQHGTADKSAPAFVPRSVRRRA